MSARCPHCGGEVRFEASINFLVCKSCCECLYVNEAGQHREELK